MEPITRVVNALDLALDYFKFKVQNCQNEEALILANCVLTLCEAVRVLSSEPPCPFISQGEKEPWEE